MKDGHLQFPIVSHVDGEFSHNFEVGPFLYECIFLFVTGPFLRDDKEPGRSREVVVCYI